MYMYTCKYTCLLHDCLLFVLSNILVVQLEAGIGLFQCGYVHVS